MKLNLASTSLAITLGLAAAKKGGANSHLRAARAEPSDRIDEQVEVACLTKNDCKERGQAMGYELFFEGDFDTKGCFLKNDKVFFSLGSEEQMLVAELAGIQERIWCSNDSMEDDNSNSTTTIATTSTVIAPTTSTGIASTTSTGIASTISTSIASTTTTATTATTTTATVTTTGPATCEVGRFFANPKIIPSCSKTQFCLLSEGMCDDKSGVHIGTCYTIPDSCIGMYDPVCGCDGTTYSNSCVAHGEGRNVAYQGECGGGKEETAIAIEEATFDVENVACLTREHCEKTSWLMSLEEFHHGDYETKGCFSKNGKGFFSLGTEEEMSDPSVLGVQERIWCDHGDSSPSTDSLDVTNATVVVSTAPTMNPSKSPSNPTMNPSKSPSNPTMSPSKSPVTEIPTPATTVADNLDANTTDVVSTPPLNPLNPSKSPSAEMALTPASMSDILDTNGTVVDVLDTSNVTNSTLVTPAPTLDITESMNSTPDAISTVPASALKSSASAIIFGFGSTAAIFMIVTPLLF